MAIDRVPVPREGTTCPQPATWRPVRPHNARKLATLGRLASARASVDRISCPPPPPPPRGTRPRVGLFSASAYSAGKKRERDIESEKERKKERDSLRKE
ncbi:unnamed protein product [Protopolystoma xenopodis]|uniref:Uncharacterized protein n=1 Tax=Protopolystoma xenopodis TaxID=117903 RepID=A0A3S5AM28_9PLAT|nr:unnamed protein product [Protopolystoma xenopodis]